MFRKRSLDRVLVCWKGHLEERGLGSTGGKFVRDSFEGDIATEIAWNVVGD